MPIKKIPYTRKELYQIGKQREFRHRNLNEIAFPLGGIGTGTISLSGRGALVDWEIFNNPNKNSILPFSFFTLYTLVEGKEPITKILQAPPAPPYTGKSNYPFDGYGFGVNHFDGSGLPHLQQAVFKGEYPFSFIHFEDSEFPVEVSLEAYNPLIPLNEEKSSIPVAIFRFRLLNSGNKSVKAVLAANLFNAVGYPGRGQFYGKFLGQNKNEFIQTKHLRGLFMTSEKYDRTSPNYGSLALTTSWKEVSHQTYWYRGRWFDSLQSFWNVFSTSGEFTEHAYSPSEEGKSDVGSIGLKVTLQPAESVLLPVFITWHFPNFEKYWLDPGCGCYQEGERAVWQNYYATQWEDALAVASYVSEHENQLHEETRQFHDQLFGSTLPTYVIDALSSQISTIRSASCIRLTDGTLYGFEGCHAESGCCAGSCTHVWNYAQTLAFLFPSLEKGMIEANYQYNIFDDGKLSFRRQLPPGSPKWDFHPAADGQLGGIMQVYRYWKLSGDDFWLKDLWPKLRKVLAYTWKQWDSDRDGVIEGVQHNTYDIEFLGPNTMIGSWYMGALRAAEEMAAYFGETELAEEYRSIFNNGSALMDDRLFNGEYFIQKYDPEQATKYQYGTGCLSDQLIGQWYSHLVGLGYLFAENHVRQALVSVFKHNWRNGFWNHSNPERIYALNDEAGLVLCSWPRGRRPAFPFVYADEVWCGIEYQVAGHLIYEGYIDEGLAIVKGVRERYDGERRNPWNEFECGSHYVRSMASWGVLLALSGFSFDMPQGKLGFAPRIFTTAFICFWSAGTGWGTFSQEVDPVTNKATVCVKLAYGFLVLKELILGSLPVFNWNQTLIRIDSEDIPGKMRRAGSNMIIYFESPLLMNAGQILTVELV